ncbi:MAG: cyclic nucleotide-binding domain-containing protein [Acidimicrobiia bacterium]|nr:cyclic nucleotide-binding domain-containing protein [Acidimicrobiia bacterium]
MGSKEYLEHLAAIPLFAPCSKRDLQRIARSADEVEVEAGRTLVEQGSPGREAYVVVEGAAEVRRKGAVLATLGPGDHFGELALLDGGVRTADVVTTEPCRVLVIGSREFSALLDTVPGLSRKLLTALAGLVRELDERVYS